MCRPDKSHPTFLVLLNTNDVSLRTPVALNVLDLSPFPTRAILNDLVLLFGSLADDNFAAVGLALVA